MAANRTARSMPLIPERCPRSVAGEDERVAVHESQAVDDRTRLAGAEASFHGIVGHDPRRAVEWDEIRTRVPCREGDRLATDEGSADNRRLGSATEG